MSDDRPRLVSMRTGHHISSTSRARGTTLGGSGGIPAGAAYDTLADADLIDRAVAVTTDPVTNEPITYKRFAETVLFCNDRTLRKYRNGRRLPGLERKTLVGILRAHDEGTRRAAALTESRGSVYELPTARPSARPTERRLAAGGARRKADTKRGAKPSGSSRKNATKRPAKSSTPRKRR